MSTEPVRFGIRCGNRIVGDDRPFGSRELEELAEGIESAVEAARSGGAQAATALVFPPDREAFAVMATYLAMGALRERGRRVRFLEPESFVRWLEGGARRPAAEDVFLLHQAPRSPGARWATDWLGAQGHAVLVSGLREELEAVWRDPPGQVLEVPEKERSSGTYQSLLRGLEASGVDRGWLRLIALSEAVGVACPVGLLARALGTDESTLRRTLGPLLDQGVLTLVDRGEDGEPGIGMRGEGTGDHVLRAWGVERPAQGVERLCGAADPAAASHRVAVALLLRACRAQRVSKPWLWAVSEQEQLAEWVARKGWEHALRAEGAAERIAWAGVFEEWGMNDRAATLLERALEAAPGHPVAVQARKALVGTPAAGGAFDLAAWFREKREQILGTAEELLRLPPEDTVRELVARGLEEPFAWLLGAEPAAAAAAGEGRGARAWVAVVRRGPGGEPRLEVGTIELEFWGFDAGAWVAAGRLPGVRAGAERCRIALPAGEGMGAILPSALDIETTDEGLRFLARFDVREPPKGPLHLVVYESSGRE